jgi:hypothetical protein
MHYNNNIKENQNIFQKCRINKQLHNLERYRKQVRDYIILYVVRINPTKSASAAAVHYPCGSAVCFVVKSHYFTITLAVVESTFTR